MMIKHLTYKLVLVAIFISFCTILKSESKDSTIIYKFDMKEEVGPGLWRKTQKAFDAANKENADIILIHMNTYGGAVVSADSIRTKILNSKTPVYVFIDNNAASAGALISIACDKIFMRPGANIGAATVVNQTGQQMPDKYQSYMRSTMRATAEAHGKDTIINGTDTSYRWKRDPLIAEAMVDPDAAVENLIDTGKVITFTTLEAQKHGFCDGIAETIQEIIEKENLAPVVIKEFNATSMDTLIGFLMNPALQSILIMAIFGGLYFELQSPGIGFPLGVAILAAILYFAPLYLEGIAQNWEIALFIIGIILIGVEIFAIPGFGVAGITGITLTIFGLSIAMVDTFEFEFEGFGPIAEPLFKALLFVLSSLSVSFLGSLYLSKRVFESEFLGGRLTLKAKQNTAEGYIGVNLDAKNMVGKTGLTSTVLRPSGTIIIDDKEYDAISSYGFIEKDTPIKVTRHETNQLYVLKDKNNKPE